MAELTDENQITDEPKSPSARAEEQGDAGSIVPAKSVAAEDGDTGVAEKAGTSAPAVDSALAGRLQRIRKVPVSVIVQIAERRMALQQLRQIAPGTLLMFDKPCDSLLDVFVNNRLYCRGEAVKVGESFGIRISECNSQVVREKKVHQV